jgi:NAD(P)-dependent dehydrogenase (short-subunit alcohol dehydrogenase family)
MQNLKDKVAVVFAASGDIAGAVARAFSQHGAKVYVTARNPDAVKALAREIKAGGGTAETAKVDAMNETEIDNFLKKVVSDNGKFLSMTPVNNSDAKLPFHSNRCYLFINLAIDNLKKQAYQTSSHFRRHQQHKHPQRTH